MAKWAQTWGDSGGAGTYSGIGTVYVVQNPLNGDYYMFYSGAGADFYYVKSTDGGLNWSSPVTVIGSISTLSIAVYYDRWSNISAGLVHCAVVDSGGSDILYRNVDLENSDTLGTQVTVFDGVSAAGGGSLSITRTRGGNLIIAGSIDAGAEDGAWESADVGATWGSAIADPSEASTQDQYCLLPGWNADTQDAQLIFWDASADELSVKRYDNSANTWAETSISTSMVDYTSVNGIAAATDLANSRNVVVAWSRTDFDTADLRCWVIDDTTITEKTNVVENSSDDQGFCSLAVDANTGWWHVFYGGKSDGSETFATAINIYHKISKDSGATWGDEMKISHHAMTLALIVSTPRFINNPCVCYYDNSPGTGNVIKMLVMDHVVPGYMSGGFSV